MIIGVPREIKKQEYRVGLVPSGVRELVQCGHQVMVESTAGEGSGVSDEEYIRSGAMIVESPEEVYGEAAIIVKVKEPLPEEYDLLKESQVLFTYFHLATNLVLTQALLEHNTIAIAYETVQLEDGHLPLLAPMSEIAGKLSIQAGAYYLQKENGGSGILLGGVPGTYSGNVVIIGAGTSGSNAAQIALGIGASVTVLDINIDRLRYLSEIHRGNLTTLVSSSSTIEAVTTSADLVVGAVLIPGAKSPKLLTRDLISQMKPGSVIVDIAIDQGGCCETSYPTTYDAPTFVVDSIIHYCVANMPGAVARTATFALTNATLPYVLKLANLGYREAVASDQSLARGLNLYRGNLVCRPVAESLGLECASIEIVI